jgi:basic membrane protein A
MRRKLQVLALVCAFAMLAAACAGDEDDGPDVGASPKPGEGFLACQVTDVGGIDDKSFNATAYKGLTDAEEQLGIDQKFLQSETEEDYAPNIQEFINQGCDLIVTVGFLLGPATIEAAQDNPDQKFAIVDDNLTDFSKDPPEDLVFDNVKELTFQTDEAAFLAGYVAAGMTESGTVATFGGTNLPTVSIFMNGFAAGIRHHNEEKGTDVELLGWNPEQQDGTFASGDPTVGFQDQDAGRRLAEDFISEGADIIMPVAGQTGLGAAAAAQDAGGVNLMWVDVDGCVLAAEFCDLFITSVEKHMDVAVFDAIEAAVEDTFEGGLYVGTLENDGVGISPYNQFEDAVPQELKDEVEELQAGIIDGSVSVDPADYPA